MTLQPQQDARIDESTAATNEAAVEIRDLTKVYGEFTALDSLTLSVPRGSILGLIGPNGAGKTTTIRILVGLARPTRGAAHIAGVDCVRDARAIKRLVGYLPDKFGPYDNMRVHEYLDFFGAAFGIARRSRADRIEQVLETTKTAWMRDKFVESLSHGMQQRVGIARTLLHNPDVLILDEPANGLDPQARVEMRDLLLRLAADGKTLIVTSHILPELSRICDRIAILTHGRLRACGTLEDIGRQIHQRRTLEILLASADRLFDARAIVEKFVEPDAEIVESPIESSLRCRTTKPESELAALLSQLVSAGLPVTQFRELQTDLEEAFLTVAREPAGKATGTSTPATASPGPTAVPEGTTAEAEGVR